MRTPRAVAGLVLLLVGGALALGLLDATTGGDWPGWDEGWALVVFPLGVPPALYLVASLTSESKPARLATIGTLTVWLWGAAVFATWFLVGG